MKQGIFLIVLLIICYIPIMADGPPVDENGNILADHLVFYFDSLQQKQIQYSGFFELNDDQIKVIHKLNDKYERKIQFISPFYNDCTCAMSYAIWNKEKSFGITIENILGENNISKDTVVEEVSEIEPYEEQSCWNNEHNSGAFVFIGTDGNVYYDKKNVSIDDINLLIEGISEKESKTYKVLLVRKPPKINSEIDNSIDEIINKIKTLTEKYSINFQIAG